MDAERRKRIRVATHRVVDFIAKCGDSTEIETENISLKGLLAAPNNKIRNSDTGIIRIALGLDVVIELECHVIRSDAKGIAIQFLSMDPQSFVHLRQLVRYNAEDADIVDMELNKSFIA